MPVHDWTRVDAGIFHHFHLRWIAAISDALNGGLLPSEYYALAEQIAGGVGPDVITLQKPSNGASATKDPRGGVALASAPPRVHFHTRAESDVYAAKARTIAIRHVSDHSIIAMIEIVSPGNKSSRHGMRSFVAKATDMLRAGIHLLIVDVFPPGPRDPEGIHKAIWNEIVDNDFVLPEGRRLTEAAYIGGPIPEAFVEPIAIGNALTEMPLFLTPEVYIPLPLEQTYRTAWEGVPAYWRDVLEPPAG